MTQPLLAQDIFAQPLPDFLPRRLRQACAGKRIQYRLPAAVRERMQVPESITVSEWADKYRRVTAIDAHPGRWRNDLLPHAVKPMDMISRHHVRQVWLCWPERGGKTNVILNAAMRQVDRGVDSGNVFWLMPTENEAKKALGERIIPALKATPRTARLLSSYADDTTRTLVRFRHGPRLFPAWANSAATVSSFFGRLNIADEIDKFDTTGVGKETDILTLFFKRGRDRDDSKFLFASTPAQGYIYKRTMACQQVWEYRSRCPHCGDYVAMDAEHLVVPTDVTAEDIAHGKHSITYACNSCAAEWSETDRRQAYFDGDWFCIQGEDETNPATVGFHLSAFPLPNIPLAEIAEKVLQAKTGSLTDRIALDNGYNVKDHIEETVGQLKDDHVLKFKSELPRNLVPPDTARLALLVDPQQASFNYEIWALGYAPEISTHMVRHGIVESFEDLEGLLYADYYDHQGKQYRITAGLIDSGGTRRNWQKHSRTVEVYEWCSRHRIMIPIKGMHGRTGDMISYKSIASFPGTNKPIPGGLKRANLRVDIFKDEVERRLGCEPDDPGAISFHCDIDEAFAKHFTGETKDEHGDWLHQKRNQRIDYWDLVVYVLALREMLKLRIPRKPEVKPEPSPVKPRRSGGFVKGWK